MYVNAENLLSEIAAKHGISVEAMRSPRRLKTLVAARREFAQRCRGELGMSLGEIGELLGRHHTTILNASKGAPEPEGEAGGTSEPS